MSKVIYPGSFDPITKGHMNIIDQAGKVFEEVIIAVLQNSDKKQGMFTLDERVEMIKKIYENKQNIRVIKGSGATVDVAIANNCQAIVRGIRSLTDYAQEVLLKQVNQDISNNQIQTVCFLADSCYQFISSSMVKEVFALNKDISSYVEPYVKKRMYEKRGG